jgi:hypothetical protein
MSESQRQELTELENGCLLELKKLEQALTCHGTTVLTDTSKEANRLIHDKDVAGFAQQVLQEIYPHQ